MDVDQFPGSFFGPTTLVALLRHRARHQPDEVAYIYLADGESEEIHLSNAELDRQARAIAARLQAEGLRGERALLLYPPGLEFIAAFFGCLYAGVAAVPAYPPRMNRSLFRIKSITADSEARIALTVQSVLDRVSPMMDENDDLNEVPWVATDRMPEGIESGWQNPQVDGETLAFLQYTSGSTGRPKGVMLSHSNLLHNSALISHVFEHTRSGTGVFWLPSYHDMGLIGGILQPLYVGRPNVLMSPMAFLQRPLRWLRAITRYHGTTSGGPNFAYDLCVRKIPEEKLAGLDLSSWQVAFNGAEPVRSDTLDRFAEKFAPCGFRREAFYPCYGLAEATLIATGGLVPHPPRVLSVDAKALENDVVIEAAQTTPSVRKLVGCGQNLPDQQVLVVHPERRTRCHEGQVGEIWIQGPSVAQGYWNRPDETEWTFGARLADTDDGPYLRTGDVGFLLGGELYCTGRLKDLIIVHGLNHYPQDIELTVERSHSALRAGCSAAFTVEIEGKQQLVIAQEIERRQQDAAGEAISAIRHDVAREHDLVADAVVLLRAGSIPKTSSGKIQRHACHRAFLDDTLSVVTRWPSPDLSGEEELAAAPADEETTHEERTAAPPAKEQAAAPQTAEDEATAPAEPRPHASIEDAETVVLEEVRRIAAERAKNLTLNSTFADLGMDSLERIELQAALEDRFGGRMPEEVGPELDTMREVVEAVKRYLGTAAGKREKLSIEEIPPEYYRFDRYPEFVQLSQSLDILGAAGLSNPYFKAHEQVTKDTTVIEGRRMINFSSYNYVGMSGDPRVAEAAKAAIDRFGTSVSASRLVSGEKTLHRELEQALAEWVGTEEAIVFVGGHATNETTVGHLFGPGDLVVHDALAHNSILQGCILSGARRRAFPHNDWQALDRLLADLRGEYRRVLVAIEGVYSMDGDYPDLPRFIEVKKRHKAFLMVDEAHSIGVMGAHGRGLGEHFDVDPADVDLWMGTMSKSLGSCGGYIAGGKAVVQYLKYTAPGFVYSVGLSPANAAAALASLRLLQAEPQRVKTLHERADLFLELARQQGLNIGMAQGSSVVPVILGNSEHCLKLSKALFDRGINVQPILYPAVEESAARLRFFITSTHTEEQIRYAVQAVAEEAAAIDPAYVGHTAEIA